MPAPQSLSRRQLLTGGLALTSAGLLAPTSPAFGAAVSEEWATAQLRALEARLGGRLGVYARNHRTGTTVSYRADERFATCSTFKGLLAAHVLRDFDHRGEFLNRLVHYTEADLAAGAPLTQQYVQTGLTVRDLCAAAIAYSDNAAANLLLARTGGPHSLTRFYRSIGDTITRSDRIEPTLTPRFRATSAIRQHPGRSATATPTRSSATPSRLKTGNRCGTGCKAMR